MSDIGYGWAGLLVDPKAARQVARERLGRDLAELGSAHVALRKALAAYPVNPYTRLPDIPLSPDGEVPDDLRELQDAAHREAVGWGWSPVRPVPPPMYIEASIRQGVRGSRTYDAMVDAAWQRRWDYDGREHAKQQRVQAHLDERFRPDVPQERHPDPAGWGRL